MTLTNAKCPRCAGTKFTAHFTGLIDLALDTAAEEGQLTSKVYPWPDGASDTFVDLKCTGCRLTLANEAGETRLRRADVYDTDDEVGESNPLTWPATDQQAPAARWYEGMHLIAEHLSGEVNNLDTEVINEVVD